MNALSTVKTSIKKHPFIAAGFAATVMFGAAANATWDETPQEGMPLHGLFTVLALGSFCASGIACNQSSGQNKQDGPSQNHPAPPVQE